MIPSVLRFLSLQIKSTALLATNVVFSDQCLGREATYNKPFKSDSQHLVFLGLFGSCVYRIIVECWDSVVHHLSVGIVLFTI
jgi:hypothetical protein